MKDSNSAVIDILFSYHIRGRPLELDHKSWVKTSEAIVRRRKADVVLVYAFGRLEVAG